jgi:hypothetical protein
MSIRNEIAKEVVENEIVLEHGNSRYKLRGREDAEVITNAMLRQGEKHQKAIHWGRVVGEEFSDETVKNVLVVQKVLVPEKWEPENPEAKEGWIKEDPYDETEIAKLCKMNGPLFLKLLAASYEVLGVKEEAPMQAGELVEKTAAKNSGKSTE